MKYTKAGRQARRIRSLDIDDIARANDDSWFYNEPRYAEEKSECGNK